MGDLVLVLIKYEVSGRVFFGLCLPGDVRSPLALKIQYVLAYFGIVLPFLRFVLLVSRLPRVVHYAVVVGLRVGLSRTLRPAFPLVLYV